MAIKRYNLGFAFGWKVIHAEILSDKTTFYLITVGNNRKRITVYLVHNEELQLIYLTENILNIPFINAGITPEKTDVLPDYLFEDKKANDEFCMWLFHRWFEFDYEAY